MESWLWYLCCFMEVNFMYIYLDETASPDNRYKGYGALLSKDSCCLGNVVSDALMELKKDDDRFNPKNKKYDDATLDRGYFHACEDSKNAHSHLCSSINKFIGKNDVYFSAYLIDTHSPKSSDLKFSAYVSTLQLSSIRHPVKLVFEEGGFFSVSSLESYYINHNNYSLMNIYDLPFSELTYPLLSFETSIKSNPGIQICDFLLWVSLRHMYFSEPTWYDRIISSSKSISRVKENSNWYWYDISKGYIGDNHYYSINDYDTELEKTLKFDEFVNYFHSIEQVLINEEYPQYMSHIKDEINLYMRNHTEGYTTQRIENFAKLYLKIFDMKPIITEETSNQDKNRLLIYKKWMSLLLRDDLSNGVMSKRYLIKYLNNYY